MLHEFLNPHMNASFVPIKTTLKLSAKTGLHYMIGFVSKYVPMENVLTRNVQGILENTVFLFGHHV